MRVSFSHFGGTAVSCSDAKFPVRERDTKRETKGFLGADLGVRSRRIRKSGCGKTTKSF